jgi:hypothetical protein
MKKKIAFLIIVIVFSVFFFACEEEGIPIPLPPPLPLEQDDSTLLKQNGTVDKATAAKKTAAKSKEKPAPAAKKEVAKKETAKKETKSAPILCSAPCDTDSEQLSSGRYTIQIAVYPSESSARSLVRRMSGNGIRAYYAQVDNPAQLLGLYYRVRVGYFNGIAEAENFAKARLEPLGYAWWVDKRKNDKLGSASVSFNSSPTVPVDDELEAAKRAYREQLAKEEAAASQQTSNKKKKKKSNASSEFDWDD